MNTSCLAWFAGLVLATEQDPPESNNLAKENPAIVKDLAAQLIAWRKQMPQPLNGQP